MSFKESDIKFEYVSKRIDKFFAEISCLAESLAEMEVTGRKRGKKKEYNEILDEEEDIILHLEKWRKRFSFVSVLSTTCKLLFFFLFLETICID